MKYVIEEPEIISALREYLGLREEDKFYFDNELKWVDGFIVGSTVRARFEVFRDKEIDSIRTKFLELKNS